MSKHTVEFQGPAKAAVTREEYERGRAVLDALAPGIYCKCSKCGNWQRGGNIEMLLGQDASGNQSVQYHCEKCSS